ncbi:hypothetical protein KKG90_00235 [Candidatus Bipolaricaulota bacterium]|nr:hypothetical protein [Candidatus Bipolaricaulota bacterium]
MWNIFTSVLNAARLRAGINTSRFNRAATRRLKEGAMDQLMCLTVYSKGSEANVACVDTIDVLRGMA